MAQIPTLDLEQYEPVIEEEIGVVDRIKGSTRYAWLGSGQCGGRLVKSFYDLGYKKVLAMNTAYHDLDMLEIPVGQKLLMDIGELGAGKDIERGEKANTSVSARNSAPCQANNQYSSRPYYGLLWRRWRYGQWKHSWIDQYCQKIRPIYRIAKSK